MKIKEYSYRYAKEILQHPNYKHVYDEIIKICKKAPLPVYKGKSDKQVKKDVIQPIINTYFKLAFSDEGWDLEPYATPKEESDSLRSDFKKTFKLESGEEITIQIEVEMGNLASSYRNYFKFQLSFSYDLTNICILILPCDKLSKRIDSGVASFEKTVREIPSAKLSITVPVLVIGLDDTDSVEWNLKLSKQPIDVVKGLRKDVRKKHEQLVRRRMKKSF